MTEDERIELIKKAFEAKKQLEAELKETKEQVELKDKELNKLQEQVLYVQAVVIQAKKNTVFVSDYITRKTGVGRLGKHFFCIFFYFKKFVSDKLHANLESVGVSVIFF